MQLQELHKGGCTTAQSDMAAVGKYSFSLLELRILKYECMN